MIRMGRYDVFDKWEIVCRSWTGGGAIDVGLDRHGRALLPEWQLAAFGGGNAHCHDYIRLKSEALASGASHPDASDQSDLNRELSRLLKEIGYDEFHTRSIRLIERIKSSGLAALSNGELPPLVAERLKEMFRLGALLALRWTEDIGEIPDIEILRSKARPFPVEAIRGKRNVLDMFCARFYGFMDAIHIHDVCPDQVTLVDLDAECLEAMQRIYPARWNYVHADYKEYLREAEERGLMYDLVVTDPWGAQCREVAFDMLPAIMRRCSDLHLAHYTQEMFDEFGVALEDLEGLSRAISRKTHVDVVVTGTLRRSNWNGWVMMRNRA